MHFNQTPSRTLSRLTGLLVKTSPALFVLALSGCEFSQDGPDKCLGTVYATDDAQELTPGGVSALSMQQGLPGVQSVHLERVLSDEQSAIPDDLAPNEQGVFFRLENAPQHSELAVELVPVEQGAHYAWEHDACSNEGCTGNSVCMARSKLSVLARVTSTDGSIDLRVPMMLDYYPAKERRFYDGNLADTPKIRQAERVFFGAAWIGQDENQGSMRIVDAGCYQGQGIAWTGFELQVGVADGELVEFDMMARFDIDNEDEDAQWREHSRPIYSVRSE